MEHLPAHGSLRAIAGGKPLLTLVEAGGRRNAFEGVPVMLTTIRFTLPLAITMHAVVVRGDLLAP